MQRDEYRRFSSGIDPEEAGRRDADDGERHVVDQHLLSDGVWIGRESPLPVLVADHGHGGGARAVVLIENQTSGGGRHAEAAVKAARYEETPGGLRLSASDDVDLPRGSVGEQRGQRVALRTQRLEIGR